MREEKRGGKRTTWIGRPERKHKETNLDRKYGEKLFERDGGKWANFRTDPRSVSSDKTLSFKKFFYTFS